jgi:hypothetical protein
MNKNIKLSLIYSLPILRKHINKGISEISVENIKNICKEIELESKNNVNSQKANKKTQRIIVLSDMITN